MIFSRDPSKKSLCVRVLLSDSRAQRGSKDARMQVVCHARTHFWITKWSIKQGVGDACALSVSQQRDLWAPRRHDVGRLLFTYARPGVFIAKIVPVRTAEARPGAPRL